MSKIRILPAAGVAVGLAALCGCSHLDEKAFMTDAYGAVASKSGTAAIGKMNVMTVPDRQAFIHADYSEDVALFSPSTRLCSWRFTWSGGIVTNATDAAAAEMLKALASIVSTTNGAHGVRGTIGKGAENESR